MTEQADGQMNLFDPDTWSGRTSPEPLVATRERISESSSKKPQKSSARGDTPEWENSEKPIKDDVMRNYYQHQEPEMRVIDNNALLYLAQCREKKNSGTISFEEMITRLGLSLEDIEDVDDVEFEVEPIVFR